MRHARESFKKRLTALDNKSAEEGIVLTEAQVQALERKKQDDEAYGEIETHYPGYLGSQDTFYVGAIKGVGRIYQQTFVDNTPSGRRPSFTPPRRPSPGPTWTPR